MVPEPAHEMAQLQGARAAGSRWFPGANPPQQEQPSPRPERRRRRQAEARSDRRTGHLAGRFARRSPEVGAGAVGR